MNDINKKNSYKDISQNEFMSEVIEGSKECLVVVDFWAPWCEPCKQLGPKIEKIVGQSKNKARLVKINIDENQELAAQLQIQSIPTVYAFKNGKIANAFKGAISEKEIVEFIEKALGEKLEGNYLQIIKEARDLLNKEKYLESENLIEEIIAEENENYEAIEILIKNKIGLNKLDEAKDFIDSLDKKILENDSIKSAIESYNLSLNAKKHGSLEELTELLKQDPLNIELNKKLSDLYFSEKNYKKALSLILEVFVKLKNEKRNEAKKILLGYFNVLGPTHEETKSARKKLSSIIFS